MEIEVWSDVVCPWCYIGQRRLQQVLEEDGRTDVVVVGRSFELDPRAERDPGRTLEEMLAAKYGMTAGEARTANQQVTRIAASVGLEYHLDRARPGNTFDAHRLLHLAATWGCRPAVEERFMHAYFTEGEPIGDPGTLRRLAVAAGLAAPEVDRVLGGSEFSEEVRRDEERARALGARGVPFFVFPGGFAVSGAQPAEVFRHALRASTPAPSGKTGPP